MTLSTLAAALLIATTVASELTEDYETELTRYTESMIRELALQTPGTFECVFLDLSNQYSFDVVLEDLLRSPKLDHVVKYVVDGNFKGNPWIYPRNPSLVVIFADDSFHNIRDVPRKICELFFNLDSPTKMLILVDTMFGQCFYMMNGIVSSLRFSKVAFLGSIRKMVVRPTIDGYVQSVWEHFPTLEELLSSNVRDMHGFPISYTTLHPRYNTLLLDDLTDNLLWFEDTAKYLNTTVKCFYNPCKIIDLNDDCLYQFMKDNRIDITLDTIFPAANSTFEVLFLNVPDTHVILVPRGRLLDVFEIIIAPLTTDAWIVLLVMIISLEVLNLGVPTLFRNDPALFLICGLESYDLHKANRREKLILLAFIIFFFLVKNAYETKIVSMMTSKPSLKTVKNLKEMSAAGIKLKVNLNHIGSMDIEFLDGVLLNSSDMLVDMDRENAYLAARSGAEIYLPLVYFDNRLHRLSYEIMDQTIGLFIKAFVSIDHNPVKETLDWSHNAFIEGGLFIYLAEMQERDGFFDFIRKNAVLVENGMLTIKDLLPAWFALGIGSAVSFVLLIGELLVVWCNFKRIGAR